MKTFEAVVRRSGGWWAIEVPQLPGVFTQARRIDGAAAMARQAIALFLNVPATDIEVRVQPELPMELRESVDAARTQRDRADRAQREASSTLRASARQLAGEGLTTRDIGVLLGVTHQRIAQLLREPNDGARRGLRKERQRVRDDRRATTISAN
jgi:predicted RNase H-like HicB family nuclease